MANLSQWLGVGASGTTDSDANHWMDWWHRSGDIELLSDSQEVINLAAKSRLDQLYLIERVEADSETEDPGNEDLTSQSPADEIESTQFAQLIAAAIERVQEDEPWSVLWLHSDCLIKRWDAPRWLAPADEELDEFDEPIDETQFIDEPIDQADASNPDVLETLPSTFDQVHPPQFKLGDEEHPDLVATWMRTYGCQLKLIDELLGVLRDAVQDIDVTIVVAGTSGFSLGQNGWIGHRCGPLRSCHLHLPVVIDRVGPLRCPQLFDAAGLPDLIGRLHNESPGTVIDPGRWADRRWDQKNAQEVSQNDAGDQNDAAESRVVSRCGDGTVAVTTPNWFFLSTSQHNASEDSSSAAGSNQHGQKEDWLFLKPDDFHDVNDISRLRPDVVDAIREELDSQADDEARS